MNRPISTRLVTVAVIFLLAVGVVVVWVKSSSAVNVEESSRKKEAPLPISDPELTALFLSREKDNSEVFRRAFWRHPSPLDKIRHAERREWSDDSGVQRWDWFIAVDASDAFTSYLLKKNPFQLTAIHKVKAFEGVPAWFPKTSEGFELYQTRDRKMTVLFNQKNQRLYAKSNGYGFKAAKPEAQPVTAPQQVQTIGRLLNTPPPNPNHTPE